MNQITYPLNDYEINPLRSFKKFNGLTNNGSSSLNKNKKQKFKQMKTSGSYNLLNDACCAKSENSKVQYFDLNIKPIQDTLKILLRDKTTKENIIWATNSYHNYGVDYYEDKQITVDTLNGWGAMTLQPRILKNQIDQKERTRKKAEVFTPGWICNEMNNTLDEDWFGRKNVFNFENGESWITREGKIVFPKNKNWKDYVYSKRLEITCGEAPYLVSRYDASSGELIQCPIDRIGILDRKLRVINENVDNEEEWLKWVQKAYQSTYGYEYQGDNLLIARINLLLTFVDNMEYKWKRQPSTQENRKIANIISWNLFQMDGLTNTIPTFESHSKYEEISIGELLGEIEEKENHLSNCKIKDWRGNKTVLFDELKKGR